MLDAHWIENQSYKEQFEIVEGQNLLKLSTKYNFFPVNFVGFSLSLQNISNKKKVELQSSRLAIFHLKDAT